MPQLLAFIRPSHLKLTDNQCIPLKRSLLPKDVKESQLLTLDKEMKGIKVGILASFQNRLTLVCLRWF